MALQANFKFDGEQIYTGTCGNETFECSSRESVTDSVYYLANQLTSK